MGQLAVPSLVSWLREKAKVLVTWLLVWEETWVNTMATCKLAVRWQWGLLSTSEWSRNNFWCIMSELQNSCNMYFAAMRARGVAHSFIQVENCVGTVRCRKLSCSCLGDAESCQSFTEQPTHLKTSCPKLMPIDHHERGKIVRHAGMDPLWGKQIITQTQHKRLRWLARCLHSS